MVPHPQRIPGVSVMQCESWRPGDKAHFEYHCYESPDSADAPIWYRSHQCVTVLAEEDSDGGWGTFEERRDAGTPKCYRVRFKDGLEWSVFEDELLTSPDGFVRPDPPGAPADPTPGPSPHSRGDAPGSPVRSSTAPTPYRPIGWAAGVPTVYPGAMSAATRQTTGGP